MYSDFRKPNRFSHKKRKIDRYFGQSALVGGAHPAEEEKTKFGTANLSTRQKRSRLEKP
jgi:hypothetical protein